MPVPPVVTSSTPAISGDFVNDIIIVCTLAILIGQNLRGDIKELIDIKKREIRDYLDDIPNSEEYVNDENIKALYDYVKNFTLADPVKWLVSFYVYILASVMLSLADINHVAKQFGFWTDLPISAIAFWLQFVVWITLIGYGVVLLILRHRYNTFTQRYHNLLTNLSIATRWAKNPHKK